MGTACSTGLDRPSPTTWLAGRGGGKRLSCASTAMAELAEARAYAALVSLFFHPLEDVARIVIAVCFAVRNEGKTDEFPSLASDITEFLVGHTGGRDCFVFPSRTAGNVCGGPNGKHKYRC